MTQGDRIRAEMKIHRQEDGTLAVNAGWIPDAIRAAIRVAKETGQEEILVFNDIRIPVTATSDPGERGEYYSRTHKARQQALKEAKALQLMKEWEASYRERRTAFIAKLGLNPRQEELLAEELADALKSETEVSEGVYRLKTLARVLGGRNGN